MTPHRLYVGCIGEGVFRSLDHGLTFRRSCDGMPFVECDVRALVVDPARPEVLYVGNEDGIFVSREQGTIDRVPVLHRIPLLGWLFKRDDTQDESRELLIFITPRILKG